MITSLLAGAGKAIYWTLGGLEAAGEIIGVARRLARQALTGRIAHTPEEKRQIKLNAKGPQSPKMR